MSRRRWRRAADGRNQTKGPVIRFVLPCAKMTSHGGAMAATRSLAAIMAVDVVGYSRLMDEAGMARAVRECPDTAGPVNS